MPNHIAIIGAGIAGVSAARVLTEQGCSVTIFEKSRGFGGRCATKRWEGHVVDHGAQYFTIRDEAFRKAVHAVSGDAIQRIEAAIFDEKGETLPDTGRWYHREGNSRLVRDLARGLMVKTEETVRDARSLLRQNGGDFDQVISTAPWPQTASLFGLDTTFDYVPCITALLCYTGEWIGKTKTAYAISDHQGPLAWSACENHKLGRIKDGSTVIVTQMSEAFSREHLELPLDEYPQRVRAWIEDRWELPASAREYGLGHRWRYARVKSPMPAVELPEGLHFAGDALIASRVEDAWLAGAKTAGEILATLK